MILYNSYVSNICHIYVKIKGKKKKFSTESWGILDKYDGDDLGGTGKRKVRKEVI